MESVSRSRIRRLRSDGMKLEINELTDLQQQVFEIMKKFGFNDFYEDYERFSLLEMDAPFVSWYVAKQFAKESANEDNFFMNSICFWNEAKSRPRREPDYISRDRNMEVSSKYWYTPKGVYRQSDHWGEGVASCDWYWKSDRSFTKYSPRINEVFCYGRKLIGFAEWSDFAPKGYIVTYHGDIDNMYLSGFEFKK